MKQGCFSLITALLLVGSAWAADAPKNAPPAEIPREDRTIAVGMEDVVRLDFGATSTKPGIEGVISVEPNPTGTEMRVYGVKKGITSLSFFDEKKELRKRIVYNVTLNDLSLKVESIRNLLFDVEGITIKQVDDKVVIDGELIVPRDIQRINTVIKSFEADVPIVNLVTLSKITQESIAEKIKSKIWANGDSDVDVIVANETFILKGTVENSVSRERAEMIAVTYLPEFFGRPQELETGGIKKSRLQNLIDVVSQPAPAEQKKMVRVTWHFVEIGKEYFKTAFFKWNPLVSEDAALNFGQSTTGGAAATANGSFTGTIRNLLPKLQSGANGGFSRVLFSSVGIGMDREEISIVRSNEVPFVSAVVNGTPVTSTATAKIELVVRPSIAGENILLNSTFGFNAIVGSGQGGRPQTIGTNIKQSITVKNGESAVLGGLISNDMAKDIDRDPEGASAAKGNPFI